MQFYIKNDSGEFVEADKEIDEEYKKRSWGIVHTRLEEITERELEKKRPEFEKRVRGEVEEAFKKEIRESVEAEYKDKLAEADKKYGELDVAFRRKTIAAEYGFKPESEEFLGSGTDEEMRAKADTLKNTFSTPAQTQTPDKTDGAPQSKLLDKYGLDIKI